MRVVLHIGLHKTGTTTIQSGWREAYPGPAPVWFPRVGHPPGHAVIAWWLKQTQGAPARRSLVDVLGQARSNGVQTLVLSSEEFHDAAGDQVARLREILAGCDTEVMVTLTQAMYRWPSLWQEMVKHGWSAPQGRSMDRIAQAGVFGEGRLEELVDRWGAFDTTICLVRQHPPESDLVRRVSSLMGLPPPDRRQAKAQPENTSLGDVETRLLCELNRLAPRTQGLATERGRALYDTLRSQGPAGASRVLIDADVVEQVGACALQEEQALFRLTESGRVRVDDAWGLLPDWSRVDSVTQAG